MTLTRVAILLEIAAFFLVTLDLYGAARLNDAAEQLGLALTALRKRTGAGMDVTFAFGGIVATVTLSLAFFLPDRPGQKGWQVLVVPALMLSALCLLLGCVFLILLLAWSAALLGIRILGKVQLRGMMLVAGTVLFLVSKALQFYTMP